MRYLVSCLLAFPLLGSCTVIEEQYYDRGYYTPAPRVEVQPHFSSRTYHRVNGYRSAPTVRTYQDSGNGSSVHVNPSAQAHGQNNVHKHDSAVVHGHPNSSGAVHGHAENSTNVVIQHPKANRGSNRAQIDTHQKNSPNKIREQQSSAIQNKSHGHS